MPDIKEQLRSLESVTNGNLETDSVQESLLVATNSDMPNNNFTNVISELDYNELKLAMTNFFSALDSIQGQIAATQDAAGTVKLIESWTSANNNLAKAMDAFARQHPQITQGTLPPQLLDIFARFKEMNQKYASIPEGIRELTDRFDADPKVAAAKEKFQQSIKFFENDN
jgi:hypothetical protein